MSREVGNEVRPFRLLSKLYCDVPMVGIWSEEATVGAWLAVEAALAAAQAEVGLIHPSEADSIERACRLELIELDRLWASSRVVGYPILPLVSQICDQLPPGPAGRVHFGPTTQDIMDTGLALQLGAARQRLIELTALFGDALAELARDHTYTLMAGRTHGQQAVPTTFGAKVAVFLSELTRHAHQLEELKSQVEVVSLFGAAGTNAAMGRDAGKVRSALARRLGLCDASVPWHVARDRMARFGQACSLIAGTCVRFAREVIDLSRTEIGEVREQDGFHRGASSTMPQKTNPIFSEAAVGHGVAASAAAAVLIRGMEAGHERSAGEWQIEWAAIPDAAEHTAAALSLMAETAASLQVFPARMAANMDLDGGLLMSEGLMMRLAPTLGRDKAHELVYAAAKQARSTGRDLREECLQLVPTEGRELLAGAYDPAEYTGDAALIVDAALAEWEKMRQSRDVEPQEDGGGG